MRTALSDEFGTDLALFAFSYVPEVGTPVPAVTRTFSTEGTWLTEVPRTCRTPSAMPFMPCR